jgi:hypothetical protein
MPLPQRGRPTEEGPPSSLHCTVNAIHDGRVDDLAADLHAAVEAVLARRSSGAAGAYGTVV